MLGLWGFYSDRFDGALANRLLDFFQSDGPYHATIIGGCSWSWRNEKDPSWVRAYRRFDVISPWNAGHWVEKGGQRYAQLNQWPDDIREAARCGQHYMPVVYPGFSWDNLKNRPAGSTNIPRLGGQFLWQQFETASELEIEMVKVAMFDEVDEGTCIFKVTNSPPIQAHFLTYENRPNDWYLRLTGKGTKLIRGEHFEPVEFGNDSTWKR